MSESGTEGAAFTFTILGAPARGSSSNEGIWGSFSTTERITETAARSAAVCCLAAIAAGLVDHLGKFVSLVGAFFGAPLALVFPALIHTMLINVEDRPWCKVQNAVVLVVGSTVCLVASVVVVLHWDSLDASYSTR